MEYITTMLVDFVTNYSDQIMTLLSVGFGGVSTYFATTRAEKNKERRELQRKKVDFALVQYCKCIEETITEIDKIYFSPQSIENCEFDLWLEHLEDPFAFLNAEKRVFLPKHIRKELEQYKIKVDYFKEILNNDNQLFLREYTEYVSRLAKSFTKTLRSDYIDVNMSTCSKYIIEKMILSQHFFPLTEYITEVSYMAGDDSENFSASSVISIKDNIREKWQALNQSSREETTVFWDDEEKQAISFLNYAYKNTKDEETLVSEILDEMESGKLLYELKKYLEKEQKETYAAIDKITK